MQKERWTCTECNKEFGVGEWLCADGVNQHVVAAREYLRDDAPTDAGHPTHGGVDSLRDGRTRVCNIPPDKTILMNGESRIVPGGYVEFIRGRFSTTNPEIQHYLNLKGGWCTEARWEAVWLSQAQQMELARQQIAADRQRLENDRNELLAMQKKQREPVATRG